MSCFAAGSRKRKEHVELLEFGNVKKHSGKEASMSDAGQSLDTQVVMLDAFS